MSEQRRVARWYFGGLASAGAACVTHPIDLVKVHLQTQQESLNVVKSTLRIVRNQGVQALYNGLSASLLRQLTYSTTRFGIYEVSKQYVGSSSNFLTTVCIAGLAGAAGGMVGAPADMINVRMQNDVKLPPEQRRNYKHAVDGLYRCVMEEGPSKLFNGAAMATLRAVFMTIGQLSFYDLIKEFLLRQDLGDNMSTHFLSSLMSGAIATTLTQPIDVVKTRLMNAKPGEYMGGNWAVIKHTAKVGPLGFYKGYVPAFVRLAPQTILTFLFLEQLRLNFGYVKQ